MQINHNALKLSSNSIKLKLSTKQIFQTDTLVDTSVVTVTVFNPSSWTLTQFISVPLFALPSQSHSVLTVHSLNDSPHSNESPLPTDILPQIPSHPQYCQSPLSCGYPQTNATHSLFFPITIPPLAFRSYRIQLAPSPKSNPLPIVSSSLRSIQNGQIQLNFDPQSNLLMSLTHIEKNWTQNVQQNFFEVQKQNRQGDSLCDESDF